MKLGAQFVGKSVLNIDNYIFFLFFFDNRVFCINFDLTSKNFYL